jgi:hypothetical protein
VILISGALLLLILLCFRPVRQFIGYPLFIVLCVTVYSCEETPHAHAQGAPKSTCQVGQFGAYVTDAECAALRSAAAKLSAFSDPRAGFEACRSEIMRGLGIDQWVAFTDCTEMSNLVPEAMRVQHPDAANQQRQAEVDARQKKMNDEFNNSPAGQAQHEYCTHASPMACAMFRNDMITCRAIQSAASGYLASARRTASRLSYARRPGGAWTDGYGNPPGAGTPVG